MALLADTDRGSLRTRVLNIANAHQTVSGSIPKSEAFKLLHAAYDATK